MSYGLTNTPSANELTLLNKMLLLCGLRPVSSATAISTGSDTYFAQMFLHEVLREELQKGWFCYNKRERLEVPSNPATGFFFAHPLLRWALHVDTRRVYPDLPALYEENTQVLSARDPSKNSILLKYVNKPFWFDVVFQLNPFKNPGTTGSQIDAPAALLNYCVYKAARQFAPQVGVTVDPASEKEALASLMQLESQSMPRSNVFHDEWNTMMTWADR